MEFTTEMTRIGQAIRRAAEERTGRLRSIRTNARRLLSDARASVQQLAAGRQHAASEMAEAVRRSRRATVFLKEAGRKQAERDAPGKTRRAVIRIRTQTARFLEDAGRAHAGASNRTKEGLVNFVAGLKSGVDGLLKQSHHNMQAFAADFRRGGKLFRKSLRRTATACEQREEPAVGPKSDVAPRHGTPDAASAASPRAGRGTHRRNTHS
ncbi:MAG: hypothetical protein ABSE73_07890 [Planctomycetota bacterium]